MIVKANFEFKEKKEIHLKNDFFVAIYKNEDSMRLVMSSRKCGDIDIFWDSKEREMLLDVLKATLFRFKKEKRGFLPVLNIPQAGDEGEIINATVVVVFVNEIVGLCVEGGSLGGVEAWIEQPDLEKLIKGIEV